MSQMNQHLLPEEEVHSAAEQNAEARARLPLWQKCFLGLALLLGLSGFGLSAVGFGIGGQEIRTAANTSGANVSSTPLASPTMRSSLPSQDSEVPAERPYPEDRALPFEGSLDDWAPLLMKLGFSFVVGFCLGYALAVFMKVTIFVAGVLLLALFGLQYAEIIVVNWHGLEAYYEALLVWLQPRLTSFREFVAGNLPSVSSAALGLLMGFKRK